MLSAIGAIACCYRTGLNPRSRSPINLMGRDSGPNCPVWPNGISDIPGPTFDQTALPHPQRGEIF
jgi:hypothetical protein